jgi:hypothetical protein
MASSATGKLLSFPQKAKRLGTWAPWHEVPGGRIWVAQDGTRTYYIRKTIKGTRYQARFVGSDPIALADQLRRFYADPAGFDPRGVRPDAALFLDEQMVASYLEWSASPPPGRKRPRARSNWLGKKRSYLRWLADRLPTGLALGAV